MVCQQGVARFEPPDVVTSASTALYTSIDRKTIRYGLGAVKGTGEGAVIEILRARSEGGLFKDLFDFCRRVNTQTVNRRTVEALIKGGAFDKLHDNRASAFASVAAALSEAERAQANISQDNLFGDEPGVNHVPLVDARPWELLESLAFEKTALGLYLSGHPYDAYRKHLQPVTTEGRSHASSHPTASSVSQASSMPYAYHQFAQRPHMLYCAGRPHECL